MIAKFLTFAAAGVSVVSAACTYPPPLTNQLTGNSVTRPDTVDPATIGSPFSIVWDATGLGDSVSLILLRGPGENIQFLEYIVQGAPNTGAYTWTPESTLEPDTTHYGIMMIDDATCKFQWSSQFGLNPGTGVVSSSSAAPPTSSAPAPSSASSTGSKPSPPPTSSCDEEGSHPPTGAPPPPPPPPPSTSCDEEGSSPPTGAPIPPPKSWSSVPAGGYGSGPWVPTNGTATSAYWATGTGAATATYKPLQANGAGTLGMSLVGAAAALAATIMLL